MRGIAPLLIVAIVAGVALIAGGAGYGGYEYYKLNNAYVATSADLASTTSAFASAQNVITDLTARLTAELAKNGIFENQISEISGTVGNLTKLSQTDKELLQKYSKIYFLNENYVPSELGTIPSEDTLQPDRTYEFHAKALPYLERMLSDAKDDGAPMLVLSSYRSFGQQIDLKIAYKVTYGSGANRFSADQGYSEHQLGTALDLTTKELSSTSLGFATSKAGVWMDENAYKYGFILSYPKGNTFYQYEPWHWRFVGVRLATYLHDHNQHFYDLDQRTIDTYLIDIFD